MPARKQALVLVLAAQPDGASPIKLDEEVRGIRLKLREADRRDEIQLESYWAARPDDVMQALNQYRPDVVHFSGHGTESSELLLASSLGGSQKVTENAIASLFRVMGEGVKAVVLNSCFSAKQAAAIAQYVDVAIGMREGIGIEAAILFSAAFYRGLGYGKSFHKSFEEGKVALLMHGLSEEHIPALCVRGGVDARETFLVRRELRPLREEDIAPAVAILTRIPPGPILHVSNVPGPVIGGLSDALDTSERFDSALSQATTILRAALPEGYTERQILIRRGQLPPFGTMPVEAFWTQLFSIAGLKSRRTVASFLTTPIGHWALECSEADDVKKSFLAALQTPNSFSS